MHSKEIPGERPRSSGAAVCQTAAHSAPATLPVHAAGGAESASSLAVTASSGPGPVEVACGHAGVSAGVPAVAPAVLPAYRVAASSPKATAVAEWRRTLIITLRP